MLHHHIKKNPHIVSLTCESPKGTVTILLPSGNVCIITIIDISITAIYQSTVSSKHKWSSLAAYFQILDTAAVHPHIFLPRRWKREKRLFSVSKETRPVVGPDFPPGRKNIVRCDPRCRRNTGSLLSHFASRFRSARTCSEEAECVSVSRLCLFMMVPFNYVHFNIYENFFLSCF